MKIINILKIFVFFSLIVLVFKTWFLFGQLSSGDWGFFYNNSLKEFSIIPNSWNNVLNSGLGGINLIILGLFFYFSSTIYLLFNFFKFDWILIERIAWFWPFLIVSTFSSYFLFKKLFSNKFALLASLVYLFNTYILMIVGGGQMGIALAYSIAPIVLANFIQIIDNLGSKSSNFKFLISNFKLSIITGFVLSILVMFDLRIAYITLAAIAVYAVLSIMNHVLSIKTLKEKIFYILNFIFYIFIVPGIVTFLLNAFWLLPILVSRRNPLEELGSAYSSLEAVRFFSFAKFEDAISLLHPNWPENIFGKTGFLKPEFLILPILAYSSLFFISKTKDQRTKSYVLFFALLGLTGAFLAKGVNEPFGGIYLWMFDNFPGMQMFRDPTKWYTLVAISYSILIPFNVWKIYEWLKLKSKFSIFNFQFSIKSKIFNASNLFLLVIICCLLFLIRPAIFGQLSGTFKSTIIPNEYIKLEQFLSSQNNFSRTLWLPTLQRFGFYSNIHPAIPVQDFFKSVDYQKIFSKMKISETLLQEAGVKYVIIPFDSQGEIYLKDRKYDDKLYQQAVKGVSEISWLKPVDCSIAKLLNCSGNPFGKIAVFEVHPPAGGPKDHFYISSLPNGGTGQKLTYQYVSPVEYKLEIKNIRKGDVIVFSENYDASWQARDSNTKFYDWPSLIGSSPYNRLFNSFTLRKSGNYSLIVYYYPQILVNLGMIISFSTLILLISFMIFGWKLKKW